MIIVEILYLHCNHFKHGEEKMVRGSKWRLVDATRWSKNHFVE